MESVATQLLRLIEISGLPINTKEMQLEDGSTDRVISIPFPARWLIAHRNSSGLITINVPQGQCLAITLVEASGIDFSVTSTMAVQNSTDSLAINAQPLQTVIDSPSLYVFRPGKAIFDFVFTPQPGALARVQVHGFRLPAAALNKLGIIATEQLTF